MDPSGITPFVPIIVEATKFLFNQAGKWIDDARAHASSQALSEAREINPHVTLSRVEDQLAGGSLDLADLAAMMDASAAQTNAYIIQGLVEQIQTHHKNLVDYEGIEATMGPATLPYVKRNIETEANAIVKKTERLAILLEQVYRKLHQEPPSLKSMKGPIKTEQLI